MGEWQRSHRSPLLCLSSAEHYGGRIYSQSTYCRGSYCFGIGDLSRIKEQECSVRGKKSVRFDSESESAKKVKEIDILNKADNHPHIVKLIDHFPRW